MASGSKSTRSTTARARNPTQATSRGHTSTRLDKKSTKKSESSAETFDVASDDGDDSDTNDSTVEQAPTKGKGKKTAAARPSQPSLTAPSEQGSRTAFDVRYFFQIPDKTCHRCL